MQSVIGGKVVARLAFFLRTGMTSGQPAAKRCCRTRRKPRTSAQILTNLNDDELAGRITPCGRECLSASPVPTSLAFAWCLPIWVRETQSNKNPFPTSRSKAQREEEERSRRSCGRKQIRSRRSSGSGKHRLGCSCEPGKNVLACSSVRLKSNVKNARNRRQTIFFFRI